MCRTPLSAHEEEVMDLNNIPVTVIVPVKNEAKNIENCLRRLTRFDEVVVVDSGSTDQTLELAQHWGAKVVQFKWDGHFPKKRNWTLDHVSLRNEWVLFLDADEWIDESFVTEVSEKIQGPEVGFWLHFENKLK